MRKQKKKGLKQNGGILAVSKTNRFDARQTGAITLIALIISIVVMLILAGVSLSALVGDNGVLTNAIKASLESKFASYKEELETVMVMNYNESSGVTVTKSLMKNYISSMKDEDLEKFAIVQGELYYIGDDESEKEAAESCGINTTGGNVEDVMAIISVLGQVENKTNVSDEEETPADFQGERLYDRTSKNLDKWEIAITYDSNNNETARYGSGYYYLKSGTELTYIDDNGESVTRTLNGDYVINYETSLLVGMGEHFKVWNENTTLAVSDGIALNIDPLTLADLDTNEDYQAINITRHTGYYENGETAGTWQYNDDGSIKYGVQYDENKGALYFDGEKSYLELKKSGLDFRYGFTYEIYANLTRMEYLPDTATDSSWKALGLFCRTTSLNDKHFTSAMRFGYLVDPVAPCVCKFYQGTSWRSEGNLGWNSLLKTTRFGEISTDDCGYTENEDFYLTFVYTTYKDKDGNIISDEELAKKKVKTEDGEEVNYGALWKEYNENDKYSTTGVDLVEYYINGKLYGYTFYGDDSYEEGCNTWNNDNCPFFIWACVWHDIGNVYYLQGYVYSTRLYEKALNYEEVSENRDTTMQYRSSFMK